MSVEIQLKAIRDALNGWLQEAGGAFIASDQANMWEMAFAASSKLRVIVCCTGEEIRGDFAVAAALHRVDRQFSVLVTRGRSLTSDRGQGLVETIQNSPPLFQMVSQARDVIRSMLNISAERPVDYKGFRSFPMESGLVMDAYEITFSTAVDLAPITDTPDNPAIPL